ncbi:MAG: SIMPL domain-containing protein [Rikenellaceae bacterium]
MRKLMLLFALVLLSQVELKAQDVSNRDYIEIKGNCTNEILPDSIVLSIILEENSSAAKSTLLKQERKMLEVLKKLDIDTDKSLKINTYNTSSAKRNNILAKKRFSLILDNCYQINEIIYALNAEDIKNVSVKHTGLKNYKSHVLDAKKGALQDAKTQAKAMVKSMGYELGKVILIVDSNYNYYNNPIVVRSSNLATKDGALSETFSELSEIEYEPTKVTANVTVRFLILDNQ